MKPTVPTWVSLERGVTPSPGSRATRLSVLMLMEYWAGVGEARPAQPDGVCVFTCRLRAVVFEG